MLKDGDKIVLQANLKELEEMAERRECLAKYYRWALWLALNRKGEYTNGGA